MNESEMRRQYEGVLAARSGEGRGQCVSVDQLMELADGNPSPEQRLQYLAHIAACRHCRQELALARAAVEAARGVGRRRGSMIPLALAASLTLVIAGTVLWRSRMHQEPDVMRGGGAAITLIQPAGDLTADRPSVLTWYSVPRAMRYDVEVLDANGTPVFVSATTDTVLTVPQTASFAPGAEYRWRVTAPTGDGSRLSSPAQTFRTPKR